MSQKVWKIAELELFPVKLDNSKSRFTKEWLQTQVRNLNAVSGRMQSIKLFEERDFFPKEWRAYGILVPWYHIYEHEHNDFGWHDAENFDLHQYSEFKWDTDFDSWVLASYSYEHKDEVIISNNLRILRSKDTHTVPNFIR